MSGVYLKLFVDCLERYQKLNDAEFGRLVRAALSYKANGAEATLSGREEVLWDGMKLDIDRDNERYAETVNARSEAGKKGAAARWQRDGKNGKCHLPYGKEWQKCQDKDKDKDITLPISPPGDAFDAFWALYPKKKAKEDARKAWAKLKPDEELYAAIMDGLTRAAASRDWAREDGRYVPYPATWLRGRRWEDDEPQEERPAYQKLTRR